MNGTLTNLLQSYGYIVLFVFVGLESLGIPLPGETTLVTAAAFASSGHLSIYRVVIVAAAAAILGDNGGYWIGLEGGLRLVKRYGRVLHIDEGKMERARQFLRSAWGQNSFYKSLHSPVAHMGRCSCWRRRHAIWHIHALQRLGRYYMGAAFWNARLPVRAQSAQA